MKAASCLSLAACSQTLSHHSQQPCLPTPTHLPTLQQDRRTTGGFITRLTGIRNRAKGATDGGDGGGSPGGGPPSHAMRAIMKEQRRLEEQIVRANRSTEQLIEMMARQLASQKRVGGGDGDRFTIKFDEAACAFGEQLLLLPAKEQPSSLCD